MRVEELSRKSGVSVDTIRYYQKRSILPPPIHEGRIGWYDDSHSDRLAQILKLRGEGLPLRLIAKIIDQDSIDQDSIDQGGSQTDVPLAKAVARAERGDSAEASPLSLAELAARSGVPGAIIQAVVDRGLLGTPQAGDGRGFAPDDTGFAPHDTVFSPNDTGFSPDDVEFLAAGMAILDAGIPLAELLTLALDYDQAARRCATDAAALFDVHVRQKNSTNSSMTHTPEALAESFSALLGAATGLVGHHFRRVLLQAARDRMNEGAPS